MTSPVSESNDKVMLSSLTPRVDAISEVNAERASSSETESGIETVMVPVVIYSVTLVTSSGSTPYASATIASKLATSDSSRLPVAVVVISTETTNPTNDGALVGMEVTGDELGSNVGAEVMKRSQ